MTTTVETGPEEATPTLEVDAPESKPQSAPQRRHRTVRHVAVHGGGAGAITAGTTVLHVFGPSALGLGVAGVAAAGAGVVAARKRRKASRTTTRKGSIVRTMRRSVKTASGTRAAAGAGRSRGGAGASGRARAAPPHAASRRGAGSGRAAGIGHGSRRGKSGSSAARGGMLHRRSHKPSVLGGRGSGGGSSRRPSGARRSRGGETDPRSVRLGNRVMRKLTRASRTKDAAAARPAGKHAAPVTRAGKIRKQASVHARHGARLARRSAARSWRFAKTGAKASRPFLRLRPPKSQPGKPAMRAAAKPASAKKSTTDTANKPATKTAKAVPVAKKTVKKAPARPGTAIAAPGLTVKEIVDTNAPSIGITAAADAITEHVAGFEPENVTDILGFLSGLDHLFSTLGSSLITVAERLGSEHPVDASVVDMVQQMGSHALNLGEYGTTAHGLFRAAHETELQRLEQPRVNEQEWDVERNR